MSEKTRTIRPADDRIAELQAKIEGIKARDERRKAKAKPEVKFALQAAKALDKALGATTDVTLRTAFQDARTTVAAAIAVESIVVKPAAAAAAPAEKPRGRRKQAAA